MDAIFQHVADEQIAHLVLYFHGGLTSEGHGIETANGLMDLFETQAGVYPVFFIWETGLEETITQNLSKIAEQPLFKELLQIVLKFALSKLQNIAQGRDALDRLDLVSDAEVETAKVAETASRQEIDESIRQELTPLSSEQERQMERYLEDDLDFAATAEAIANAVEVPGEGRGIGPAGGEEADLSWFSQDFMDELQDEIQQDPQGRGLISTTFLIQSAIGILKRVVTRFIDHTDHGPVCTVTEEVLRQFYLDKVGSWVWGEMKNKAAESFEGNAGLSGELLHGGTYFLERLRDHIADPANPPLKLSMVGHSAGSIYICELFKKAIEVLPGDFKFNQIIFLAPGVDFELFNDSIVAHPDRFNQFMLYTMNDDWESRDNLVPLLYPRSLLYFVSGVLEGKDEKPIVGLERFYSARKPYDTALHNAVRAFIKTADPQRVVWSKTSGAGPGLNCEAEHHGGFAFEATTQNSLVALLKG